MVKEVMAKVMSSRGFVVEEPGGEGKSCIVSLL